MNDDSYEQNRPYAHFRLDFIIIGLYMFYRDYFPLRQARGPISAKVK